MEASGKQHINRQVNAENIGTILMSFRGETGLGYCKVLSGLCEKNGLIGEKSGNLALLSLIHITFILIPPTVMCLALRYTALYVLTVG